MSGWRELGLVGLLLVYGVLIVAGPLLLIWSVNTLFGAGIEYEWRTWLAALLLGAPFVR